MNRGAEQAPGENMTHVFEVARLGKAPFYFVGIEERRGPITVNEANGVSYQVGAPGQPMGSCQYCGTAIAECCIIRSADGKKFIVGNECVRKTDDRGLINLAKRALNKARAEARHKREEERIGKALENLPRVQTLLANRPHPYKWMAEKGYTALGFVEYMFDKAGNSGKIKAAKLVEGALDEIRQDMRRDPNHEA